MTDFTSDVRAVQRHVGAEPDGLYGPQTALAVLIYLGIPPALELAGKTRQIQHKVGAAVDGKFGPRTARALRSYLSGTLHGPVEVTPTAVELDQVSVSALDPRTRSNLFTLEPEAQRRFLPFILKGQALAAREGLDWKAISGTRDRAEQDALYAKGRTAPGPRVTNARYGYSNHNFGIALDFGVFRGGRYLDSSEPKTAARIHREIAALAKAHGIEWGGSWARFKDYPHFEVKTGLSMAEKRRRLFAGRPILN